MPQEHHFRIDYLLEGAYKTFYIRADRMDNADAWHWAAVDAGFGQIPKYRTDPVERFTRPKAERCGISDVEWTRS